MTNYAHWLHSRSLIAFAVISAFAVFGIAAAPAPQYDEDPIPQEASWSRSARRAMLVEAIAHEFLDPKSSTEQEVLDWASWLLSIDQQGMQPGLPFEVKLSTTSKKLLLTARDGAGQWPQVQPKLLRPQKTLGSNYVARRITTYIGREQ